MLLPSEGRLAAPDPEEGTAQERLGGEAEDAFPPDNEVPPPSEGFTPDGETFLDGQEDVAADVVAIFLPVVVAADATEDDITSRPVPPCAVELAPVATGEAGYFLLAEDDSGALPMPHRSAASSLTSLSSSAHSVAAPYFADDRGSLAKRGCLGERGSLLDLATGRS